MSVEQRSDGAKVFRDSEDGRTLAIVRRAEVDAAFFSIKAGPALCGRWCVTVSVFDHCAGRCIGTTEEAKGSMQEMDDAAGALADDEPQLLELLENARRGRRWG